MAKKVNETTPENMFIEEDMKKRHRKLDKSWESVGEYDSLKLLNKKQGIVL